MARRQRRPVTWCLNPDGRRDKNSEGIKGLRGYGIKQEFAHVTAVAGHALAWILEENAHAKPANILLTLRSPRTQRPDRVGVKAR